MAYPLMLTYTAIKSQENYFWFLLEALFTLSLPVAPTTEYFSIQKENLKTGHMPKVLSALRPHLESPALGKLLLDGMPVI